MREREGGRRGYMQLCMRGQVGIEEESEKLRRVRDLGEREARGAQVRRRDGREISARTPVFGAGTAKCDYRNYRNLPVGSVVRPYAKRPIQSNFHFWTP